jgi:hypothetical protein
MGRHSAIGLFLQLESSPVRYVAFAGLVRPGSILMGKHSAIGLLLQLESSPICGVAFAELVRPKSILLEKCVEIDAFVRAASPAAEFRKLSIR